MKDEFLASMSHEPRTPLTAMLGRAEGLQTKGVGAFKEIQLRYLATTEDSGRHLTIGSMTFWTSRRSRQDRSNGRSHGSMRACRVSTGDRTGSFAGRQTGGAAWRHVCRRRAASDKAAGLR